jgi:hypothetical protein
VFHTGRVVHHAEDGSKEKRLGEIKSHLATLDKRAWVIFVPDVDCGNTARNDDWVGIRTLHATLHEMKSMRRLAGTMAMSSSIVSYMVAASVIITSGCSDADQSLLDGVAGFGGGYGGNGAGSGTNLGPYRFRAGTDGFQWSFDGGAFRPFWPIGINYGHGIPGTRAGEFVATHEQIGEFIRAASDLGVNSIRVYTVQSPIFYEELRRHNIDHPDKPIFLLQGAWLADPTDDSAFSGPASYASPWVDEHFADELQKAVDVVHGNRHIPSPDSEYPLNYGRAFGDYKADVSPWLLGWLIGREMDPLTMLSTHELYYAEHCGGAPCTVEFSGEVLSIEGANPSEALVTRYLDFTASYEAHQYGESHPIAFATGPALDPMDHIVDNGFDDMMTLDLRKIQIGQQFEAGLFFSYNAYPDHPEFILHEPSLQVEDEIGPNSYLGYLQRLRAEYIGRTLLIAEVGLPSSQGSANFSKSGFTHGGLDEAEQGAATLRALRTITRADMDGAFLFEIIDEWWKPAWIVERVELPANRSQLWYNAMSPAQNFGFVAMRPGSEKNHHEIDGLGSDFRIGPNIEQDAQVIAPLDVHDSMRTLRSLTIDSDEGFLHLLLRVESLDPDGQGAVDWGKVDYLIGIDTLDANRGDGCLDVACHIKSERRVEFLLRIESESDVTLNVDKPYDLVGVWHGYRESWQMYHTAANDDGLFNLVRTVTSDAFWYAGQEVAPIIFQPVGQFRTGAEATSTNTNFWYSRAEATLEVRIPWTLLNVTDPSQRMVVDDDVPGTKDGSTELQIRQTPSVSIVVAAIGGTAEQENIVVDTMPRAKKVNGSWVIPAQGAVTYSWPTWDENPQYRMYRKQSFGIVQQALSGIVPESAYDKP